MQKVIATFLLATVINIESAAQSAGGIFFDFRAETNASAPRLPLKASRRVLAEVFPKYLAHARYCSEDSTSEAEDYLAAARQAGQIVPSVIDMASGSFTTPGETQIAYLISVGECDASHADNWGTKRLAIFIGNNLVADLDIDFKSTILKKSDLNFDGINELLMSGGDMNQGIVVETAALYEFRGGSRRLLQDFEKVSEDSCGSGTPGSGVDASVIVLTPVTGSGRMPKLHVENYRSSCGKTKRWRFTSKGNTPL